jgi:D-alanine-D-alanine ligase
MKARGLIRAQLSPRCMKITILAYLEPGATEPDVVMPQVAEALEAAGHKAQVLTIHDDVPAMIAGLKERKPDLVYNLVEAFADDIVGGLMGVVGVLDLLQIPYTGGGPGELYLQEDKALAKRLLAYEKVPYPDYAVFAPGADLNHGAGKLQMPLFVKPLRMDASLGIDEESLVRTKDELIERVHYIHQKFGHWALVEEYIEGREFYVGVLGNEQPLVFPPIEMDFSGLPEGSVPVLDTKAKWDVNSERYQGTKAVIARLEPELQSRLQRTALDAYRALRVRDYGRIDMRLSTDGEIHVIEVNASCYLERGSEFAMSAAAQGIEYGPLINRIGELALERWNTRAGLRPKKRKKRAAKKAPKPTPAEKA